MGHVNEGPRASEGPGPEALAPLRHARPTAAPTRGSPINACAAGETHELAEAGWAPRSKYARSSFTAKS
eukprot:5704163-Alexandrium_andersonii.AAC.1